MAEATGTRHGEPRRWLERHLGTDRTDDCIEWPYGRTADGYGAIYDDGRMRYVTHLVLEAIGLPRPDAPGDHALHSCDRPACVNPRHLRWGASADNMRDKCDRGRRGNTTPCLTEPEVSAIRWLYERSDEITQQDLADYFGVTRATIGQIVRRETWQHVA